MIDQSHTGFFMQFNFIATSGAEYRFVFVWIGGFTQSAELLVIAQ